MPVIVLAVNGREVLVAQGGKWLTDTDESIFKLQKLTGFENTPDGRLKATQQAEQSAKQLGPEVKFTPLEWKDDKYGKRYSTRFVGPPGNPVGFLKGTYPDPKFPNESPVEAAIREVQEETGFDIRPYTIVPKSANVFLVEIPKEGIIQSWRAMGRQGELIDLRWEPIADIRKDIRLLNTESQAAIQYLPSKAGTRRRRRRGKKSRRRL